MWVRVAFELTPEDDLETWLARAREERARHQREAFQTNAVKFFADGVLPGRTAYLKEDYADEPGFRGRPIWPSAQMEDAFVRADRDEFQIVVHAVGDAASAQTLDAFARLEEANGERDRRGNIAHLRCVDPVDIPRLAALGVTAAMQPYWFLKRQLFFEAELPRLGPQRALRMYPMQSYFDAGALVTSSSDWYVTRPPDPLQGIQTGIMRWFPGAALVDEPLNPPEGCTVEQMIRSFTINGARSMFLDHLTGSIEAGKSADLVVLDRDILTCRPEEIGTAHVQLTVSRGRVVYEAEGSRS
jgi:predicted amidohydrolase YtcJ